MLTCSIFEQKKFTVTIEYLFQNLGNILSITFLVIYFIIMVPILAGLWRIFEKAGRIGILAFVPILNAYLLLRISQLSALWLIPLLVPGLNIVILFIICFFLSNRFGRSWGTALGLFFLPIFFFPILGFGKSCYFKQTPNTSQL